MKILHLVTNGGWAGTEIVAHSIASWQAAHGHDVTVLLRANPRISEKIILSYFAGTKVDVKFIRSANYIDYCGKTYPDLTADVVHAHLFDSIGLARSIAGSPRVFGTVHVKFSHHYLNTDGIFTISPWQVRDIPPQYKGIVCYAGNYLPAITRQATNRERVAFKRRCYLKDSDFVVMSIGRIELEKGMDTLCRAFQMADIPNSRLVIIGDGSRKDLLESIAGSDKRIVLTGQIYNASSYIPLCDLYVSAARFEPFGLTILEAMHCQKPIIATQAYGTQDTFEIIGRPEHLIPPEDEEAMASKILEAYKLGCQNVEYGYQQYFNPDLVNQRIMSGYMEGIRHTKG